jgi:hypothetical protein
VPTTSGTCWQCDLIARVRADERRRWGLGWVAAADNVAALAHAEAVAARLVEVICEQEWHMMRHAHEAMRVGWSERCRYNDHARGAGVLRTGCANNGSSCLCWCHDEAGQ